MSRIEADGVFPGARHETDLNYTSGDDHEDQAAHVSFGGSFRRRTIRRAPRPEYDYVPHAKRLSVTLDVSCVPASGRLERGA